MHGRTACTVSEVEDSSSVPRDDYRSATQMEHIVLNRLWNLSLVRKPICLAGMFVPLLIMLSSWFGIRSGTDVVAYACMARECHPVWQDLALHRIYEGQAVEEVITSSDPVTVVRHGRFVSLGYQEPLSFNVIQIVAIDGKLAWAYSGSCTWDHTFFGPLNASRTEEMSESYEHDERTVHYNGVPIAQ
ncbi:hypothetical protein CA85_52660 [Allorhodopirellula solitaria]|uniref:Uncharacterized protein n=2 Tax=Allorhodopirellula solitaria TaxID=2527987 RepID=A0A5C5WJV5_9BACT|nr:hypothetical protein CA85_52660 [Allorhodopirellula solitaria]